MEFKPGRDELALGMVDYNPVLVVGQISLQPPTKFDKAWFDELWGDEKTTKRIKTWGHQGDRLSAHFLAVRGGTPMHTDPGYARYCVHVELANGGFVTHGLKGVGAGHPIFMPGLVTVLDTHSPHQVSRDKRLFQTHPSKLAMSVDFPYLPTTPEVWTAVETMTEWLPTISNGA